MNSYAYKYVGCEELYLACEAVNMDIRRFENETYDLLSEIELREYFDESCDDLKFVYEAKSASLLDTLGKKIVEAYQKFVKFITEITNKIKHALGIKPKESDLKRVFEKHPEYADAFLKNLKSGNAKFCDYKDLDSVIDAAEKAVNDFKSGRMEEKSFVQKMNDLITKIDTGMKPTESLIKTIGGIGTGIIGILAIRNTLGKTEIEGRKTRRKLDLNIARTIDDLKKENDGTNMSAFTAWWKLHSRLMVESGRMSNMTAEKLDKIANFCNKMYLKLPSSNKNTTFGDYIKKSNKYNKFDDLQDITKKYDVDNDRYQKSNDPKSDDKKTDENSSENTNSDQNQNNSKPNNGSKPKSNNGSKPNQNKPKPSSGGGK